jgi:hypothetical protein
MEGFTMKPKRTIAAILGMALIILCLWLFIHKNLGGLVPGAIGASLVYLGYKPGRAATLVFGHSCVVVGCYLITWGLYLLPSSQPIPAHILGRPLFWGLFCTFGGICAIHHGFCRCVIKGLE